MPTVPPPEPSRPEQPLTGWPAIVAGLVRVINGMTNEKLIRCASMFLVARYTRCSAA